MIRRVAGFVYVAAFAPDQGQSAGDLNNQYPATPGDKEFSLDANGFLKLTDQGVAEDFAQDLTTAEKQLIAATQGQVSGPNELGAKVTTAAWRQKPTLLYRRRPGPNDRAGVGDKARRAVTCEDDPHRVQPCSHAFTSNPGRRFHRGCCGRSIR